MSTNKMDRKVDGVRGKAFLSGLSAAGFDLLDIRSSSVLIPVSTAWAATTCLPGEGGRYDITFDLDDIGLVAKINSAWTREAALSGLLGEHDDFALSVPFDGDDPEAPQWASVRIAGDIDVAGVGAETGVLGFGRGRIEFAMASFDGRVVVRGTVWQHAVGLLILTEANSSERLRALTTTLIGRGLLSESERRRAENWMGQE
ncbi:MAG: hypothetical protein HOV71_25810 [Hamadaea sp.]|nr:hypothetical protein [Hamadaea sp.]